MVDSDSEKRRQEAAAWFSRLNQRRVSTDDIHAFAAWRRNPESHRPEAAGLVSPRIPTPDPSRLAAGFQMIHAALSAPGVDRGVESPVRRLNISSRDQRGERLARARSRSLLPHRR